MISICALCRKNEELQNSHIIPEFYYKMVYDQVPRRFRVVSTESIVPDRYEQKGLREKLLCKNCELKFSRLENYAKRSFFDSQGVQVRQLTDAVVLSGIDS